MKVILLKINLKDMELGLIMEINIMEILKKENFMEMEFYFKKIKIYIMENLKKVYLKKEK